MQKWLFLIVFCWLHPAAIASHELSLSRQNNLNPTQAGLEFSGTSFPNNLQFDLVNFSTPLNFSSAKFLNNVAFRWATFSQAAEFTYATFNGYSDFRGAKFLAKSHFTHTNFKDVSFLYTDFLTAAFSFATFSQTANFNNATFAKFANFTNANFDHGVKFINVTFNGHVDFDYVGFGESADFSGTNFNASVSFVNSILPEKLNFARATISTLLDLREALPPPSGLKCKINLLGTDITKVRLRYQDFQLDFPPETSLEDIQYLYQSLLDSLKTTGDMISYNILYLEYQHYKYAIADKNIIGSLNEYFWNYGLDPSRGFLWIAAIIFILSLGNACFLDWLLENTFDINFLKHNHEYLTQYSHYRRWWLIRLIDDLPKSVVYTTLIFFGGFLGVKREIEKIKSRNLMINFYIVLIILSGLFANMFIFRYVLG